MTELRLEPYIIPADHLGPENPLPIFRDPSQDSALNLDDSIPAEDRRYLGWRTAYRVLPYRLQDNYTRHLEPRGFSSIVLENEILKAIFLPELGGRLVSLYHKPVQRELIERLDRFQPANLALRNAWFSGGIEWNASHFGHHYLTCSPVYAARVKGIQGESVLRIYEWDRVKRFPWQIDFHLPPGSPFLFARVRLVNPHNEEIPMYWWTNMAVAERTDVRVLCPAREAIYNSDHGLALTSLPEVNGEDISYTTNMTRAREYYFRMPQNKRPWIAAVDGSGQGFIQTSTSRLCGRKLFCWGTHQGGRRWQEYLSGPGRAYLEIQAGLARTQQECVPMPANTSWAWTEAYGLLDVDPVKVHQPDWSIAISEAESRLNSLLPFNALKEHDTRFAEVTSRQPEELLHTASSWATLQRRLTSALGREDRIPSELVFNEQLTPDQQQWLDLLQTGSLPEPDPQDCPGQFMVQPEWRELLEKNLSEGHGEHWYSYYHLGNMRYENFDTDSALQAWRKSLELRPSAWALRNLAMHELRQNNIETAADLLHHAITLSPQVPALAVEYAQVLVRLQRYEELLQFIKTLPQDIARHERILLAAGQAALHTGDLDKAREVLNHDFATIREGELSLTDLWFKMHEQLVVQEQPDLPAEELNAETQRRFPPPPGIDFRMSS